MPHAGTIKKHLVILLLLSFASFPHKSEARVIEECIYLVPAGKIEKKVLEKLKEKIPALFPMSVKVVIDPPKDLPSDAYDPSRKQYNAQTILDGISDNLVLTIVNERAVVVTDMDLYVPNTDFVFGLADAKKGMAVISLARIKNEFYGIRPDGRLLSDRALKEVVRELGRSWKLSDCASPKCVMSTSNDIQGLDKKRDTFCYKCRIGLENRSGTGSGLLGSKIEKVISR